MVDQVELRSELLELAERCERATAAEMGIDADIERALGMTRRNSLEQEVFGNGASLRPRRYSGSLDAAMTLVPKKPGTAMGEIVKIDLWDTNGVYPPHVRASAWVAGAARAYAATPALALCSAALRARTPTTPERSDD